jgi:hypothetical protein
MVRTHYLPHPANMPASWIFLASGLFRVCAGVCRLVPAGAAVSRDPRTHSGRAWVPLGRSMCTVGCFTDGHGRAMPVSCSGLTSAAELSVHPYVSARRACFPYRRRAGKADEVMAGLAVRETVTLAGQAERVRVARAFVRAVLGSGHQCRDDAELLVSELFGNSVRYSRSGILARRSRWRSRRGTKLCGSRSPTGADPGYRSRPLSARMLKAGAGFSSWRASRRGGVATGRRADGYVVRAAVWLIPSVLATP